MGTGGFLFWKVDASRESREIVAEAADGQVMNLLRGLCTLGCLNLDEAAKMIGELLNRRALTGAAVRVRWIEGQVILQVREAPITPDEFLRLVNDSSSSALVFQDSPEIAVSL